MKTLLIILTVVLSCGLVLAGDVAAPGSDVSDFTLKDASGKAHTLSSYKSNEAIVLIFVSTKCPISNAYNSRMAELFSDYSGKGVAFIGINSNRLEEPADIAAHAKENGLKFAILKDEDNAIADKLGASVTPEIFVLDKNLKVLYQGRIDDAQRVDKIRRQDLRKALDEVLAKTEVTNKSTKAFGCSIKRERN